MVQTAGRFDNDTTDMVKDDTTDEDKARIKRELSALDPALTGRLAKEKFDGMSIKEVCDLLMRIYRWAYDHIQEDYNLTRMERGILFLLTQGHSYKTIAEFYPCSEDTVRTHVRSLYQKMGVHKREEIATRFSWYFPYRDNYAYEERKQRLEEG
jgi:DNA-binding NarL/FixJ family response regulator